MKKIILMIVAVFAFTMSALAQQTTVEGSRFFDNTYVGVSVGGQVGLTDMRGHGNWTVAPVGGLYLGKWFTPAVGLELNGDALFHDGFTSRNKVVDASYVGLNARLNLNNVFHRYTGTPDRVEVIPFVGFGWLHAYGDGVADVKGNAPTYVAVGKNAFGTKMGVDLAINVGKERAWVIDIRPNVVYALTGVHKGDFNPKYNVNYGRLGLDVGFTYKFGHKNSKGVRTHNFARAYTAAEYDAMVAELSNVKPETERVVETVVERMTVEVIKEIPTPVLVVTESHFTQNSDKLDLTTLYFLNVLANEIKEDGKNYVITGFASVEGDNDYNNKLSLRRAISVRDVLVKNGVDTNRLSVNAGGPTDKFGEKYEDNRVVVINEVE